MLSDLLSNVMSDEVSKKYTKLNYGGQYRHISIGRALVIQCVS